MEMKLLNSKCVVLLIDPSRTPYMISAGLYCVTVLCKLCNNDGLSMCTKAAPKVIAHHSSKTRYQIGSFFNFLLTTALDHSSHIHLLEPHFAT